MGAGRFSDDGWLDDPRFILAVVQHAKVLRALRNAESSLVSKYGRPRLPGSYLYLYVAFCIDRDPDVESFYNRHDSDHDLWARCGFDPKNRPSLSTLYVRFAELADERIDQAIQDAIAGLIATARKHAPDIGRHVHIDGTLTASHARLRHECTNPTVMANSGYGCRGKHRHPLPRRMSASETHDRHHAEDAAPFDDSEELNGGAGAGASATSGSGSGAGAGFGSNSGEGSATEAGDAPTAGASTARGSAVRGLDARGSAAKSEGLKQLDAEGLRRWGLDPCDPSVKRKRWFERDDHLLSCRDGEAGVRTYTPRAGRGRTTIGMNHLVVTDHVTGGLLAFKVVPAHESEASVAAGLMDQTRDMVGLHPQAMVADRGFHVTHVFNALHDRQIAYVGPWRQAKHRRTRDDVANASGGQVDRHGVIRCRECGGPTRAHGANLGVTSTRGRTAIRVQCIHRILPGCGPTQTVQPSAAPRLIGPLNRTDEVYWQLRHTHSNFERGHAERLARYTVGGRDTASRTKRLGIAPQHVRLRYAQLLDWLRICLRYGWVKPPRGQRKLRRHAITWRETSGSQRLQTVLKARVDAGLEHPRNVNQALDAIYEQRRADRARDDGAPPPRTA